MPIETRRVHLFIQASRKSTKNRKKPIRHFLGRRFIAGARFEHTTYQIFMSGSGWPITQVSCSGYFFGLFLKYYKVRSEYTWQRGCSVVYYYVKWPAYA